MNSVMNFESINAKYYKGTKPLKFISNSKSGPIMRDFSVEKSFESFCTDSSMRSNYDEKLAEAAKIEKELKAKELQRSNYSQ